MMKLKKTKSYLFEGCYRNVVSEENAKNTMDRQKNQ